MSTPLNGDILDGDIVWSLEKIIYLYYQMDTVIVTQELTMYMSLMNIYLYRKFVKNPRMLFCQLEISALTHHNDLLDFNKVFKEFIPSPETPVSTRSRSLKCNVRNSHVA